jgi:regulator of sigma E protease
MQYFSHNVVPFIFVLGILVFVHEFGHYAVAKLFKVRVDTFSLGFGKRLIGFRRGDTDYRISLLPLGGYVKMAGENPMESRTGDPGEFMSHPRWQRFLIAIAGPAMNILLAVAVLAGVYMFRHQYPAYLYEPAVLGWVNEGSPAQQAGLQTGDRITIAGGKSNPTWDDLRYQIFGKLNQNLDMTVQRGDRTIAVSMPVHAPEKEEVEILDELGLVPEGPSFVVKLEEGKPAAKAGIQLDDEIVAVNDVKIQSGNFVQFFSLLQKNKDNPARVTIKRKGETFERTVVPQYTEDNNKLGYRMGVVVGQEFRIEKLSFRSALSTAVVDCKKNSSLIFKLLGQLFTVKGILKQFSGPVGIMQESGRAAHLGFAVLLQFMALISLNLAIFNMLPIPILDGGLVLMLIVEGVMRRDIKQEVKERVYQAAFVFLVLFAAVVIFNDVAKQITPHLK